MWDDEPRIVHLMVVDFPRKINELSLYLESIHVMVVVLHVCVLLVANPNICGPLKHTNVMLMNLLHGSTGYEPSGYG